MDTQTRDLFTVTKVLEYNEHYRFLGSYKFCHFSSEVLNMEADELENFVNKTIGFLTSHRDAIVRLKGIDVSAIENYVDPLVYKRIIDHGITNIYELRQNVHRRHNGEISSRIVGVAKVKGKQIVKAMEELGYMIDLYTTKRWD